MHTHRETIAGTTVRAKMGEGRGERGGSESGGQTHQGKKRTLRAEVWAPGGWGRQRHLDGHQGGSGSALPGSPLHPRAPSKESWGRGNMT